MSNSDIFEKLVLKRMERFNYLLEKANFQFKQYQFDGVKWCLENEIRPEPLGYARGGLIADEMGLGKTLLMIGTMYVNYLPRTLIVVPPVLIHQWYKEIFRTTGHTALLYYGKTKKKITLEQLNHATIVLTTYNSLLPNKCLLKNIAWNRVIFDEAHHLRNSGTRRFKACCQLRARIRWLVSGTPVQNKKQDFYNLCYAFGLKPNFYKNAENLQLIRQYFVLHRTKQQVGIDLPPVNKEHYIVEWKNESEMKLSEEIHALIPNQSYVSQEKYKKLAGIFDKGGILLAILKARQSCILPNLMRQNLNKFSGLGLISNEYLEALNYTSKLDAVIELILARKYNGKGKIIFCHFQQEIDAIGDRLLQGGLQKVIKYDGRNSGGQNLANLSEPADALVIQIQTGCEGLNLQNNFSEIYFVSPHWNPSIEDQAVARCHRIGQMKPVDVFKFEMQGFKRDESSIIDPITLEKYVNQIQNIKRFVSKEILNI